MMQATREICHIAVFIVYRLFLDVDVVWYEMYFSIMEGISAVE